VKSIFYFVIGILIGFQYKVIANDYIFEHVTSNKGITFNAINSIVDDKYGFIWFGCNNGLYYYNSSEITKFNFDLTKPDAPRSSVIRKVYKDKTRKLWICTNDGISWFNEDSNSFSQLNFTNANDFNTLNATLLHQINIDNYLAIINGRLYKFNTHDLKLEQVEVDKPNTGIVFFTSDTLGNLYIAANNGSIYKTDSLLNEISLIHRVSAGAVSTLSFINDQLWIGYINNGIEIINSNGEQVDFLKEEKTEKQHIISNRIRRIVKRGNNEVWIGTQGGITVIRRDGNYDISPNIQNSLPHEGIFDLFVDRNDGVWVGTWSGGLAYHHKFNYKFQQFQGSFANKSDWNSVISSFAEDKNGTIWVGSENHGLYLYNPTSNSYQKKLDSPFQRVKYLSTDNNKRLWVGTLYEGLWLKENEKLKQVGDTYGIISTVLPTDNGVWVGERGGGGAKFYNEKQNTVEYFKENAQDTFSISSNSIWNIFKDSKDNIWFCSDYGVSVRFKNNYYFTNYDKNTNGLSSDVNYTFAEDKMGNIWIGTAGSGIDIYNPKTKTFSKFSLNESIKDAHIYSILRDKKDNMWFSSNQGIYAYYHDSRTLKNFTKEDGLLGQQYHPNSGFISKDGLLYFGGGNGFSIIDPEVVQPNTNHAEIFLSKITVNNKSIVEQKPRYINSEYISAINQIELNYNQNSISVAFVANSFIKNSKSNFKYRLLNYIDEWNVADYNANVSFTKIPPGDYILQVEYLNNDGLSVAPLKEIKVAINPPFWLSWYAYLIYSILVLTVIFIAVRELRFREKSRAEHILFTEKVKFFTNISHEFRTPLTLIISPINNLIKKFVNEPDTFDNLRTIQRNADRLLRLTNQILDFRLIEINSVKLKREKTDLISLCKNVYDCFEFQIKEKEINCIFKSAFKSFELYVDSEKIEKVVYNILSNAVKYSDEKGQIILSIDKKTLSQESYSKVFSTGNEFIGDVLEVKIKNSGKGIKKNILNKIFDRFFVDHETHETGTGIGLHICQEYMRLHNGNIMVESEPGKETTFAVNIPIESQAHFEEEKIVLQSYFDSSPAKHADDENDSGSKTKPVILFAEDNNDLRVYYKNLLSSKYKVISAKNGTQAFEIASELVPGLIISDILMPGLDGMSLTEKIRNTSELKHIPIILLTAISDEKVKIESMHKGANDFLTKPVDEELLFAKINSVLNNAEILKNKYKVEVDTGKATSGTNQTFIEKIEKIVEKNLQNQSFEITELASQIGTSRSSLQRKIKKTVNMSPSEFIREVRLKKAVELLKSGEYNIDEIAIIVGFNSTSYFIRSFKMKYEMTPTAFKQSIEK
jgi:signal transduction histidine kinase/ligand-binding sensor domain-containing protein/AraC-like DNA-binding protein